MGTCVMVVEWRPVVGYEGLYEVSNDGRVRSLNYNKTGEVRELRPGSNKHGYKRVNLFINGEGKTFTVHRLVAHAFLPNPDNLPCVNHKDEDKTNNHVSNLEFCTVRYNNEYSNVSIPARRVLQFTKDGRFVAEYESMCDAERHTGVPSNHISYCCNNKPKHKSAGGYVWRFK